MLKTILRLIGSCWDELANFVFAYQTIIEVIFILIYTTEQAFLIWATTKMQQTGDFRIDIISYFALLVLLTFSLHKLVIESRAKIFEAKLSTMKHQFDIYRKTTERIVSSLENEKEDLNSLKTNIKMRGEDD
jgi:hypothetical protein